MKIYLMIGFLIISKCAFCFVYCDKESSQICRCEWDDSRGNHHDSLIYNECHFPQETFDKMCFNQDLIRERPNKMSKKNSNYLEE